MDIIWHGHSCFTIKGKRATIVTDPYVGTGSKHEKFKGDMVLASELQSEKLAEVEGQPVKVDLPGEYEIRGVSIQGIQAPKKTVIYTFLVDDVKICHMGQISDTLPDEMIEKIGDVDVLMIPVGGKGGDKNGLEAKKAHEIIEDIEPRLVIPMGDESDAVQSLLKISGVNPEPKDLLTIAGRTQLPQDKTEYVVLNAR
jgi:L-ascorbate metabolism protein UlaG (beta-lactamase superfamily)